MSYIRSCNICGQRISLREMQNGQWVAFEVNTNELHKHNKKSKSKKSTVQNNDTMPLNQSYNSNSNINNKEPNYGLFFLIGLVIIGIWLFS